jgi:hypothetical protein
MLVKLLAQQSRNKLLKGTKTEAISSHMYIIVYSSQLSTRFFTLMSDGYTALLHACTLLRSLIFINFYKLFYYSLVFKSALTSHIFCMRLNRSQLRSHKHDWS